MIRPENIRLRLRACRRCPEIYYGTKHSKFCPKCRKTSVGGRDGFKKCPAWLKQVYRRSANYKCQECGKYEREVGMLEAHRIKRGNKGGLYTVYPFKHKKNNVKIVCNKCHKKFHEKEGKRKGL